MFGPNTQQNEVYEQTALPLLSRLFNGENCILFAYGMTNAGKTYTIQGDQQNPGLVPRLISSIFQRSAGNCKVDISMLEIYQEKIYDLLSKSKEKLNIRDGSGKVEVPKLSMHPISSTEEATKFMCTATARRSKASTFLNSGSSRSHAVYTITLRQSLNRDESSSSSNINSQTITSEFHIVDLAGSERSSRTKASIAQQKEANNINVSLMQLWRCLQGMRRNKTSSDGNMTSSVVVPESIIPFRDSKLTHLLMPILIGAGSGGVSMIACVNPHIDDYDETLSILGNASLALKIKEFTELNRTGSIMSKSINNAASSEELAGTNRSIALSRSSSNAGMKRRAVESAGNAAKKRSYGRAGYSTTSHAHEEGSSEDSDAAMRRMQKEMEQLRQENLLLAQGQMNREAEIRMEVSQEMAQRSCHLLEQIQDLREQLSCLESQRIGDVKKSAKKVRRQQIDTAQEDTTKDLREAEEELERVKTTFESQIAALLATKTQLEKELYTYKEKHQIVADPVETAAEQAIKLQKEQRFRRKDSASSNEPQLQQQQVKQKSPPRSPLGTVTTKFVNSPKAEHQVGFNSDGGLGKLNVPLLKKVVATASPQRIRVITDENLPAMSTSASSAAATYMTRLRANALKL